MKANELINIFDLQVGTKFEIQYEIILPCNTNLKYTQCILYQYTWANVWQIGQQQLL